MAQKKIIDSSATTDSSHGSPVWHRSLEERLDAGLILIDKPAGPTSHQVAAWAKEILGIDHLAHGGTLDPFATGLLTLMTGRARRLTSQVLSHDKEYVGVLKVGGEANMAALEDAIHSLRGEIYNVPPSESAVKVQVRTRRIRAFEILDTNERLAAIRVACDAGTYVRTLARDLGLMIDCPIQLVELRRTRSGRFTEEEVTEEEVTEEADLMEAMMSKLMEDSFTGGQEISEEPEEEPEVVSSDPIICPICNAQNPPGSSMCATCSYQF